MADEKRQLILDLLARAKTRQGTDEAAGDLDKLGRAAEGADKKTSKLGKTTETVSNKTDKLGHNLTDTKSKVAGLDKEIEGINKELGGLARRFADASAGAERLDISKSIRRVENDLRRVTKNRNFLSSLIPDDDPGPKIKKWTSKVSSAINDGVVGELASSSFLGTTGAVVGTTLAPMIGGLISGAIVGGVGLGGILGGVALAASADGRIQAYGEKIGSTLLSGIQDKAKDAFSGPILKNLGKLEALSFRTTSNLGKMFKNLAPSLGPFVDSIVGAADALEGAFVNASAKAGPVMAALGRIIEGTSESLARLINVAAEHADEGASSLDDLNTALQNTIDVISLTVDSLSTIKGGLDSFDQKIDETRYNLEDHVGWLDLTADGYDKGSKAAELYRQGVIGAAGSVNDYNHYLEGAANSTNMLKASHEAAAQAATKQKEAEQELTNQLKAQTDPAFAVLNAMDGVRDAQKAASEATERYGRKSEESRAATRKLAEAAISLQSAAGQAGGSLDGKMTPALQSTLRQAGLTKSQIAAVAAELRRGKQAADAWEGTFEQRYVTTHIDQSYQVGGADFKREANRGNFRAAGGPIARGVPYVVGENGPEIVVPDSSGRVLSAGASRGLMANAAIKGMSAVGGAAQSGISAVRVEVVGGADQAVASLMNYLIRKGKINVTAVTA